jgi:hypothetical protein
MMTAIRRSALALAILAGIAACQGENPSVQERPDEATAAPDRPAPALTNPGSPTPVGPAGGAVERDPSAGAVANDSMALPGR